MADKPQVEEAELVLEETGPAGRFQVLVAPVRHAAALTQPVCVDHRVMGVLLHRVDTAKPTMEAVFGHEDLARFHAVMATHGVRALALLRHAVDKVLAAGTDAAMEEAMRELGHAKAYADQVDTQTTALVEKLSATMRVTH